MTTKLLQAINSMRAFARYRDGYENVELVAKLNELSNELSLFNRYNVEAHIPVTYLEEIRADIGGLEWSDFNSGYEILSGYRTDKQGNEWRSFEEFLEARKKENAEKYTVKENWDLHTDGDSWASESFTKFREVIHELSYNPTTYNDRDIEIKYGFRVYEGDSPAELFDELYSSERDAEDAIKQYFEDEDAAQEEWEDLEFTHDEVMWNTVYRYGRGVDHDVAARLGLAVVKINKEDHEHEGEEFLALTGCGMDLSPLFVAYQALAHGAVREEYVDYLSRRRDYFESVVSSDVAKDVYRRLGIDELIRFDHHDRHRPKPEVVDGQPV